MKRTLSLLPIIATLAACAENPDMIKPTPVSSLAYQNASCAQLAAERNLIVTNVNNLTKHQREKQQADAAAVAIGMVLFWPALFLVDFDNETGSQLAQAKGQYDAIEAAMTAKRC